MWWPALGAVAVGVVGVFAPDTLGVGYYNISHLLSNQLAPPAILFLCGMKLISWSISLGSGTSGGTLAPLLTIGGGMGAVVGHGITSLAPALGVDVRLAALVGMAALFAGASRAMLASAVFAFETTLQPHGLLPLLGGCASAYLISSLLMRNSIMTEKIARRGVRAPGEYVADLLDQVCVHQIASASVVSLRADDTVAVVRRWIESAVPGTQHQGFPVLDANQMLIGVLTRRDLLSATIPNEHKVKDLIRHPPKYVYDDCTAREAADHMVNHDIGRLPVVSRQNPTLVHGMLTRSDILSVFRRRVREYDRQTPSIRLRLPGRKRRAPGTELTQVSNRDSSVGH
jgi:CBS domain-containing protein